MSLSELICITGQTWIIFHDISLHIIFSCELVLWNLWLMDAVFCVDDLYSLKCCYNATCYMNCEQLDWTNFIADCSLWRFRWVVMSVRILFYFAWCLLVCLMSFRVIWYSFISSTLVQILNSNLRDLSFSYTSHEAFLWRLER